jgi:hypothetical protein
MFAPAIIYPMKKILFCLFLILSAANMLSAQKLHVEKSDQFDEPDYTWNQLLQFKNGNTLFFHRKDGKGIEVTVYDKNRKKIAQSFVESDDFDDDAKIRGLYEINGEAVLFFFRVCKEPVLFRYRINAETGTLIQKDELGHLEHLPSMAIQYKFALGAHYSGFDVAKDPNSDFYTVITYDAEMGIGSSGKQYITVAHFDGSHKKINEARYAGPPGYKHFRHEIAVVDGGKAVYLLFCGFKNRVTDKECTLVLSKLSAGATTFKHAKLNTDLSFDEVTAYMVFNHSSNKIQLMTTSLTETKYKKLAQSETKFYTTLLTYIDPETLEVKSRKQAVGEKVNAYALAHIKEDYTGIPFRMILNKDNTTAILMEERNTHVKETYLSAAGIAELSGEGVELQGYALNKQQLLDGTPYVSYNYVNTSKGRYVFYNDLPGNIEKNADETSPETAKPGGRLSTICVKLNDNSVEKSLLFDASDSDELTYSLIGPSDYNSDSETYVTLIMEGKGKKSHARIAWVTFN